MKKVGVSYGWPCIFEGVLGLVKVLAAVLWSHSNCVSEPVWPGMKAESAGIIFKGLKPCIFKSQFSAMASSECCSTIVGGLSISL